MFFADILHNCVPISIEGLKNPHKSVVRNGGFTRRLVPDLCSPSHGRGRLIFLNGVLLIIRQYNDLHFFGFFFFFGLFLEWLRRRCRCWRVNFLIMGFLLLTWLYELIQAARRVVASGADPSSLIGTRHLQN